MSQDIASLSFQIDSSQADHANQKLDQMRGTVEKLSASNKALSAQTTDTQHSLGGMADQVNALSRTLQTTGPSLDDLIGKMQKARSEFGLSTQSLKSWDDAAQQVNALGRAFNTTAAGLTNYVQAANGLDFSSQQTAQSLQRITLALENQTAVGAQLRKVMSEYGVSLRDLNVDQADEALRRLADRFSKTADSAKRTRDIQSVMGTLDPDALGRITAPNYVPIGQQLDQTKARTVSLQIERDSEMARVQMDGIQQRSTRQADLAKEFPRALGVGPTAGGTALPMRNQISPAQMAALRAGATPNSPFANDGTSTAAGRAGMYEELAKQPRDYDHKGEYGPAQQAIEAAQIARGNTFLGPGRGGLFHSDDGTSMLSRMFTANTDGTQGAQRLLREADARKRLEADPSILNQIKVGTMKEVNSVLSTLNLSRMPGAPAPPRPTAFSSVGDAETLAATGDQSFLRYQEADRLVKSFGVQKGDNQTLGMNDADTDAKGKDMLDVFNSAYGGDGGAEMQVRLNNAKRSRSNALRPNAEAVDQSTTALRISRLSLGDQGKERARAAFIRSTGGDPESNLQSPAVTRSFDQSYDNNSLTSNNEFRTQNDLRMKDMDAQSSATFTSATSLQDKITYQQAYNKALGETADETERKFRADKAVAELDAQRLLSGQKLIADLIQQNNLEKQRQLLLGSPEGNRAERAGGDAQAAIGIAAQKESDARKGNFDAVAFATSKMLEGKLQANASVNQGLGSAVDDVDKAKQLLSVSDQRSAAQSKFNRELEIDIAFTKDRAAFVLGHDQAEIKAFDDKIARIKAMREEQSLLIAEAAAYKLGRDFEQRSADLKEQMAAPRGDARDAVKARQDTERTFRESGLSDGGARGGLAPQYTGDTAIVPKDQRGGILERAVAGTPVPPNLLNGVIMQESGWDANARRRDGGTDLGLGQITASTGAQPGYGVTPISRQDATDPQKNATFAAQYLAGRAQSLGMTTAADFADPAKVDRLLRAYNGGGDPNYASNVRGQMAADPDAYVGSRTPEQRQQTMSGTQDRSSAFNNDTRNARIQEAQEGSNIQFRQAGAGYAATLKGNTADANMARLGTFAPGDELAKVQSINEQRQALQQYRTEEASAIAQTNLSTDSNNRLADATARGGKAIGELTDKMKIEAEVRSMGAKAIDQTARARQLETERTSGQSLTLQQQTKSLTEQRALSQADVDAGIFAGPQTRGAAVGAVRANQFIDDHLYNKSDAEKDAYRELVKGNEIMNITQQEQQKIRDGFIQMGDASMSAFNQMITHGGNAKQVMSSLLTEVSNLFLKMAEAPIKNAAGDFFNTLLGGAKTLFSGGGGAATPASGGLYASGGAFVGGVKMMAGGGILDRPTKFMAAGGMAVAGEVGNEAVMPLRRMPNGDLGVSGGGGRSVTVNAPITISGGASQGSDGKMDPKMMDQMQRQLAESVRIAVLQGITDEKRPGGSLY